jgi:hypothetical protein
MSNNNENNQTPDPATAEKLLQYSPDMGSVGASDLPPIDHSDGLAVDGVDTNDFSPIDHSDYIGSTGQELKGLFTEIKNSENRVIKTIRGLGGVAVAATGLIGISKGFSHLVDFDDIKSLAGFMANKVTTSGFVAGFTTGLTGGRAVEIDQDSRASGLAKYTPDVLGRIDRSRFGDDDGVIRRERTLSALGIAANSIIGNGLPLLGFMSGHFVGGVTRRTVGPLTRRSVTAANKRVSSSRTSQPSVSKSSTPSTPSSSSSYPSPPDVSRGA